MVLSAHQAIDRGRIKIQSTTHVVVQFVGVSLNTMQSATIGDWYGVELVENDPEMFFQLAFVLGF